MPLVKCVDCQTEVSDSAVACPRCARPIAPPSPQATPAPKKVGFFDIKRNLIGLLVLAAIGCGAWYLLPDEKKQLVRTVAAGTGADALLPWETRAQNLASLTGTQKLGEQIVSITHPTASFLRMEPIRTAEKDGVVTVTYPVIFAGGLTGSEYRMTVEWRFDKARHIGVEILEDTAPTPVLTGSVLNARFQDLYVQIWADLAK